MLENTLIRAGAFFLVPMVTGVIFGVVVGDLEIGIIVGVGVGISFAVLSPYFGSDSHPFSSGGQ